MDTAIAVCFARRRQNMTRGFTSRLRATTLAFALVSILPGLAFAQDAPEQPAPPTTDTPPATSEEAKPETPAEAPTPAGPNAEEATAKTEGDSYNLRVRELEEKVEDLKEKIFTSKSRLNQLKAAVLSGSLDSATAKLVHVNELSNVFNVVHIVYSLDGTQIENRKDDDGSVSDLEELVFFDGTLVPGAHNLSVYADIRGNGFGIFSYLNGYQFDLKSSTPFTAEEGKLTEVRVVLGEAGDVTTKFEERLNVQFKVNVTDMKKRDDAQARADE